MTSARSELQRLLVEIADMADALRGQTNADQALEYAKLHWVVDSVARLISYSEIATVSVPPQIEHRTVDAALTVLGGLRARADVNEYLGALAQISRYSAMISALPGQPATGGGSFLKVPDEDDVALGVVTPLPGGSTTGGGSF